MRIDFSRHQFHPVVHLPADYEVFDFTAGYDPFRPTRSPFGIGKYNEKRRGVYTTDLFAGRRVDEARRDVHVGIDISGPVGTAVHAFYPGVIFRQGYNPAAGDYGYTIVTRHQIDGVTLFALYGHLDARSISLRIEGDAFAQGDVLGFLGDVEENGGWNPHLHFQLSYEEPSGADMPGVVTEDDRVRALSVYPDPRLVLGALYED